MNLHRSKLVLMATVVVFAIAIGFAAWSIWPYDPFVNVQVSSDPYDEKNHQIIPDGEGGAIIVYEKQEYSYWSDRIDMVDSLTGFGVTGYSVSRTYDGWITVEEQTTSATDYLTNLHFVGPDTGTVVGYSGNILRTTDGGDNWVLQTSPTSSQLNAVCFVDPDTGWAVGNGGVIIHTTDGGANWSAQTSGTASGLSGVDFVDANNGWAVGGSGLIVHTNDGGANWSPQTAPFSQAFVDVDFFDVNYGVAISNTGIAFTSNGGSLWQDRTPTVYESLWDVEIGPDGTKTFVVGETGTVFSSDDKGYTWTGPLGGIFENDDLYDVSFGTANTVVFNAGQVVFWSPDKGQSWVARGIGPDIYAQRVDADGNLAWTTGGVPISAAMLHQSEPHLATDGSGGAIVAWKDYRDYIASRVYAQRVDHNGNVLWTPDGVAVNDTVQGWYPSIAPDESGGAYFVWQDRRTGSVYYHIYAQRVDASGAAQWTANGIPLCNADRSQSDPVVTADGFGGAIAAWRDNRSISYYEIYAQRVGSGGSAKWTYNGKLVSDNPGGACSAPNIVPDGFGGAIVVWNQTSGTTGYFAQRVGSNGTLLWPSPGVGVGGRSITADGNGGAIFAWSSLQGGDYDIYAQHITAGGDTAWAPGGVPVCVFNRNQTAPVIVSDGAGGAILVWQDTRNDGNHIYGQRIDSDGNLMWDPDGVLICGAAGSRQDKRLTLDGYDGAIVTWRDNRGPSADIYAQRIDRDGYLRSPAPAITSVVDAPGDQGGMAVVSWAPSFLDAYPEQTIIEYSVWRRNQAPGSSPAAVSAGGTGEGAVALERALAAGIGERLAASLAQSGWVYLDKVTAYYLDEYGYDAPTYGDSTSAGNPYTGFMVIAHTSDQFKFWKSRPDSGYSVDNLAPGAPLALAGEAVDDDARLTWDASGVDDEDLSHYAVYRGGTSGFTPGPGTFLATAADTVYLDTDTGGMSYYYKVTAVDVHENESPPSNEVFVDLGTGIIGKVPVLPKALTVLPNSPNPFGTATTIRYGLPATSDVEIEVYDVAGRRVFADRISSVPAGWHGYEFSGTDLLGRRLASGVYFYRVSAAGKVLTKKMVMAR